MNENEIASKIIAYLDKGAAGLKSGTLYRLQRARQHALARLAEPQRVAELAVAGKGGTLGERPVLADLRLRLGLLLIVGGVLCYQSWPSAQQVRKLDER